MKKLTLLLILPLFFSLWIGTHANAAEPMVPPAYLEKDVDSRVANDLAVKLSDEINVNIGRVGLDLLRSVNTRDGLIVLLRYFAENCQKCKIAAQLTEDVMPTNITNYFLSPERAVSPTLDSRLIFTSDDDQTAWEWFPDTTITASDLGCLNCLDVHCPD